MTSGEAEIANERSAGRGDSAHNVHKEVTSDHSRSDVTKIEGERKNEMQMKNLSASKRNQPLALPNCIRRKIVSSDKIDTFNDMRDGEAMTMVENRCLCTRATDTIFRLEDDLIRVSYHRSRCCIPGMNCLKGRKTFDIRDVIMARIGRDGLLRAIDDDFPERQCFSVVFKGRKKSLNFMTSSHDSAECWVEGINHIKTALENLSPRLTQQLLLWEVFRKSDKDNSGHLTFSEVQKLFRRKGGLGTREDERKILGSFLTKTTNKVPYVDFWRFIEFYQAATLLPGYKSIFDKYSADKTVLTSEEIRNFLQNSQGENDITEDDCFQIIEEYEMNDEIRENKQISVHGFVSLMLSPNCDVFNRRHDEVYQDMDQPLSHYFIASSHNTYLMADQLRGPSNTDAYMKALLQGCRCVELDCWDGPDCEPVIFHGYTLTSKIRFRDAITVIGKYAFKTSKFPVILSIENHCSVEQQEKMARYMKEIIGAKLVTDDEISSSNEEHLPSPAALQERILVKGKKLPSVNSNGGGPSDDEVSDEDEAAEMDIDLSNSAEERGSRRAKPWRRHHEVTSDGKSKQIEENRQDQNESNDNSSKQEKQKKKLKLSKNLSDQVVYCKSSKFRGIDEALESTSHKEISSFSENKAYGLASENREKAVKYHARHLNRTYPGATRTDSSNYNPQPLWNAGFQVVALNYQTKSDEMTLYHGKFRQNGRCGYVLKPEFMRSSESSDGIVKEKPQKIVLKVVCGSDIAVDAREGSLSVEVSIEGDPRDEGKLRTKSVKASGYNPSWDECLSFEVSVPSLAMVWFKVFDDDSDNVGQFVLPLTSLAEGYRTVRLLDREGNSLKHSHLLVHVTMQEQLQNQSQ